MWEIYDSLIEKIPDKLMVREVVAGTGWTMVRTDDGVGLSMTTDEYSRESKYRGDLTELSLKELAQAAKSWNFHEAGIGVAAINAYYNSVERVKPYGIIKNLQGEMTDSFQICRDMVIGKKVTVVGHFPNLEQILAPVCELSILERKPQPGDYPDSACEYILKDQDYVFITGVTLINKTLPRLLDLCCNAKVIMVGPSVPLAPVLFRYSVIHLGSFVVKDASLCKAIVTGQSTLPLFYSGERVQLRK